MGYFKNLAIEMEEKAMQENPNLDIPDFTLAQEDCPMCGGFGYTLEPNWEDGETMVGCTRCSIAHQERQPIPIDIDALYDRVEASKQGYLV